MTQISRKVLVAVGAILVAEPQDSENWRSVVEDLEGSALSREEDAQVTSLLERIGDDLAATRARRENYRSLVAEHFILPEPTEPETGEGEPEEDDEEEAD
jgi:hypothetical protein